MAEYPTWESETAETKMAGSVKKEVRQSVSQVKDEALHRGKGMAEEQKSHAANTAHRIAAALEDVASDLENDQPQFASLFRTGAQSLDNLSRTLRDRDTESLLRQAQDFARRQPAVVLGGTIAAGFFLSRFLKSSPTEEGYTGLEQPSGSAYEGVSRQQEPFSTSRQEDVTATTTLGKEEKIYGRD